ncbi:hypothetical protein HPB49_002550 [Dermacentor silvarum]|uniref:Uncharacterized protein n=1 Tax=Dermacentor silvarum TaxID=543639 RepID=A0ACB8DT57_DERSI|nr:hypothetical protein HPB49_002550 [Dermacentor silvarum]
MISLATEQRGLADCVSPGPARGREGGCRDDPNNLATVFPYRCVVCGFCSFTQDTMIAHMRLHSGQTLRCRASDACCQYSTPFEDVLRKHVSTEHADDDAVARCPHCGMPCSSAKVLTRHAAESHHNLALKGRCADCAVMLLRHFGLVAEADTAVRVFSIPFAIEASWW